MPRRRLDMKASEVLHLVDAKLLVLLEVLVLVQTHHSRQETEENLVNRRAVAAEEIADHQEARNVEGLSHNPRHAPELAKSLHGGAILR